MDIDLNLLRVFELLYEEGNMTRAAARLCLTQSAVSHALARLRIELDDPLFLRIPSGLQPTERAHQLAPRLRTALAEIRNAVAAPVFDLATTSRRFTISASSYFCSLTARVIKLAREKAPGVSLQIVNLGTNLTQAVDQQQVDLVLGAFGRVPVRFRSEWLFQDEFAWVTGAHHPPSDHEAFLTRPRVGIVAPPLSDKWRESSSRDDIQRHAIPDVSDSAAASSASAKHGPASMVVYDVAAALAVTAITDMVALVPRRYAETIANPAQIRIVDLPKNHAAKIELSMLWHSRVQDEPGSLWLRSIVREAVRPCFESAPLESLPDSKGVFGGARMRTKEPTVRSQRDRNKVAVKHP
jgi:DNA-binding transcriptional LysR family regulator